MIWDIILQERPEDASKVSEFFFLNSLPTPVIVTKPGVVLPDNLFTLDNNDNQGFFTGFTKPATDNINHFFKAINFAKKYFKVSIVN